MNPTFKNVCEILVEQLGLDTDAITPTSRIREDLGADSLDFVELILSLEEEFNADIPDADAEKLLTVQDVIDYLNC